MELQSEKVATRSKKEQLIDIDLRNLAGQIASIPPGATGPQGPAGPQGVAGPVGPAGLTWEGVWSDLNTYAVNDAVSYAGASWFCINAVGPSATTPDNDPTNWALLAAQGAQGPIGPQGVQGPIGPQGVAGPVGPAGLNWQGQWLASASYNIDDAVGYNGASWFCLNPVSSATPPDSDPLNWALLAAQGAQGPQGPQGPAGGTVAYTSGLVFPNTSFPGALLQFDVNTLATNTTNLNVSLPQGAPIGKEVFVLGSLQLSGNTYTRVFASGLGNTITNNGNGYNVSNFNVYGRDIVRFTSLGNDYWIAENIKSSPLIFNGSRVSNLDNRIYETEVNFTNTALSAATLTSTYPNISYPIGLKVICPNINLMYIKSSLASWVSIPITAVV